MNSLRPSSFRSHADSRASALVIVIATLVGAACDGNDPGTESGPPVETAPGASMTGASGAASSASGSSSGAAPGSTGATPAAVGSEGSAMPGITGGTSVVMMAPCEKKVTTAAKTVPDFMIVLDRSLSMKTTIDPAVRCNDPAMMQRPAACMGVDCANPQWMGTTVCGGMMPAGVDRWTPAVSAIKSLTAMFEKKVSFGLTTFPGEGTGRNSECTTGVQRVPVGAGKAAPIAMALDATQPGGYTPTSATLQAVLQQIQAKKTSPDSEVPPQYVLLVTDGSPNCVGANAGNDPQAHQATIQAVDALAKAGVKTYVIGYDATVDPKLAGQLTEYAQHGGTNNFFAVQDAPSLVMKFSEITSVVADCSYTLEKKPDDKRYVRVELDKETVPVDSPDGWSLNEKTVTLNGASCAKLRDGNMTHTFTVTVECAIVDIK